MSLSSNTCPSSWPVIKEATIDKLSPLYTETLYHMLHGGIAKVHQEQIVFSSIKGGNGLLMEKMAATLPVHLNKPLSKVAKNARFTLTFRDGEEVEADILILAIPCSTYAGIEFAKVIPEERLEKIKSVQYGTNAKILIPFSKPPLNRASYIDDRLGTFFDVEGKILTLYHTGQSGFFTKDTIADSYRGARNMLQLGYQDRCPPYAAPVMAEDRAFKSYEGPVGYSWPNDPFVKGSYSYMTLGLEKDLSELFTPIGNLYFAGEHCSLLTDTRGTMEAAAESGERAARLIRN